MHNPDAVTPQPHHGPNDPDFHNQDTPPRPASATTDRRTSGRPTSADEAVAIAQLVDQAYAAGYRVGSADVYAITADARRLDEHLPDFEHMRSDAYAQLGDVLDTLRSDWRPGAGPNDAQADALQRARVAIAAAKTALTDAARAAK